MAMAKRIFLFMMVNILVIATITIVLRILGLDYYMYEQGMNYGSLMVFCAIWGMGGAFISLMISKWMAKMSMGVKIVDPNTADGTLRDLVQTVHRLAQSAGLPKMPEVGYYDSPEVNAFATGPSKSNSLVAVSSGLLRRMEKSEVDGVLGHEIAHIANGDMVTMTLIQGVMNAFVMFFARIAAFAVVNAMGRGNDERPGYFMQFALVMAFQIVFGILGMIVVNAFSRWREFRADAGGARLAGRPQMIAALKKLQGTTEMVDTQHAAFASLKISGKTGALAMLFSTHPSLEVRIDRLQRMVG